MGDGEHGSPLLTCSTALKTLSRFSARAPDLLLCPLSPEQLRGQVWILGHVLQPGGA